MSANKSSSIENSQIVEDYLGFLLDDQVEFKPKVAESELERKAELERETEEKASAAQKENSVQKDEPAQKEELTQKEETSEKLEIKQLESEKKETIKKSDDLHLADKAAALPQVELPVKPVTPKPVQETIVKPDKVEADKKPQMPAPQRLPTEGLASEIPDSKQAVPEISATQTPDPRLEKVRKLLARIPLNIGLSSEEAKSNQTMSQTSSVDESVENSAQSNFLPREIIKQRNFLPKYFQTLVFQVGKLPLAVPLIKLGGIIELKNKKTTQLIGMPDWFVGLVPGETGNLMMVDTELFLMPERSDKSISPKDKNYKYLIVLDNSNWALACHSVGDAKELEHSHIRWSEKNFKKKWLAGMVTDYMSALIEVDELINQLADNITK